jgi:hypothetical protein
MNDLVYVALAILFVAVISEGLILAGVMRQLGAVLLAVRPAAPRDVGGGPDAHVAVDLNALDLNGGLGAVFVFLSPNCTACEEVRSALPDLPEDYPSTSIVPVIAFGTDEERRRYAEEIGPFARLDLAYLHDEWDIPGTPYVVSVDRSKRIQAKGIVTTREQLTGMAEIAERDPEVNEALARRAEAAATKAAV